MSNMTTWVRATAATAVFTCGILIGAEAPVADQELDIKQLSEAFGHFIGRNLKSSGMNFDVDSLVTGIRNGSSGKPAPMSDQEYEQKMMILQERALKRLSEENLSAAVKYLQDNSNSKGTVEIEPGKLQYVILQEGTGPVVTDHAQPSIQYTGKFIDGSVFGSSEETGGPITIPLDQTIPGFSKGLVGMKEGEKRRLFVHPDLGYGTSGHLPPNSLLIFDVEIVKANADDANALPVNKSAASAADDDDLDEEDDGDDDLYQKR